MRILLTGQDHLLTRGLVDRLQGQHELLCLNEGSARELVGCQTMIHLWSEQTQSLESEARKAGVKRIIRVVLWPKDPPEEPNTCIIVLAPLIGPGDPSGSGCGWLSWAHQAQEDPAGRTALLDHRDALGGIESAVWKGRAGAVYRLAGPTPTQAQLREMLRTISNRAVCQNDDSPVAPPVIHSMDTSLAESELGWWYRSLEQSLTDTVAGL